MFSLRENGFIVYIPRYAIKGPVYLESKEKEVLYCGRLGPVWQRGVVTRRDTFVKVETIEGTNRYRLLTVCREIMFVSRYELFDHVTVGIQMVGGDHHANTLKLSLLDPKPWEDGSLGRSVNFLKEARRGEAEAGAGVKVEEEEETEKKKSKINPYEFFEDMRKVGLRPLAS